MGVTGLSFSMSATPCRFCNYPAGGMWGVEYREETYYMKNYIGRLKQKLEKDPKSPQYILTQRGFGYRFVEGGE